MVWFGLIKKVGGKVFQFFCRAFYMFLLEKTVTIIEKFIPLRSLRVNAQWCK
jgi:hypothetical protein